MRQYRAYFRIDKVRHTALSKRTDYCVLTVLSPMFLQHKSFQTFPVFGLTAMSEKKEVNTSQALTTGRREGSAHYHTKTYKGVSAYHRPEITILDVPFYTMPR